MEFGDLSVGAVDVEGDQASAGVGLVSGPVGVSEVLLRYPGGPCFPVGVAGLEEGAHPYEAVFAEAFVGGEQHPSDPLEGVVLAAPMAEGVLLGTAADVVDRLVGEADGVEVVDDQGGLGSRCSRA